MITFEGTATIARPPRITTNTDGNGTTSFVFLATDRPARNGEPVPVHLPAVLFDELPEDAKVGAEVHVAGYLDQRNRYSSERWDTQLIITAITGPAGTVATVATTTATGRSRWETSAMHSSISATRAGRDVAMKTTAPSDSDSIEASDGAMS